MRRGVVLLAAILSMCTIGAQAVQAETADAIMESRKSLPVRFTPITKLKIKPACVNRCERGTLMVCNPRVRNGSGPCSCHRTPRRC
jgi:hypothetical protein